MNNNNLVDIVLTEKLLKTILAVAFKDDEKMTGLMRQKMVGCGFIGTDGEHPEGNLLRFYFKEDPQLIIQPADMGDLKKIEEIDGAAM